MPYIEIPTESGVLRGFSNAGVTAFLGVPYGAPTGGENRFRAPQPVSPWEGVRDALQFGQVSPQVIGLDSPMMNQKLDALTNPNGGFASPRTRFGEDCLNLNIWMPTEPSEILRPVLVWLHGGGFTDLSGNDIDISGDVLAGTEDIIAISVNHRLGVLGFLDLREFDMPDSANVGMLDIIAALEWVHRNISQFGGDPARVTIAGHSGGSGKVEALFTMPAAQPYFARGIMMSGPYKHFKTPQQTIGQRRIFMEATGTATVDQLQQLSVEEIVEGQRVLTDAANVPLGSMPADEVPEIEPSIDPIHMPSEPFTGSALELLKGKQLLIGLTSHEGSSFLIGDDTYMACETAEDAISLIDSYSPGEGQRVYAELSAAYPYEPARLLVARHVSSIVALETTNEVVKAASHVMPVWQYEWLQPTEVLGGALGAYHSVEIGYVFGTLERLPNSGRDPRRIEVSRQAKGMWAEFVRSGDLSKFGWKPWSDNEQYIHPIGHPIGPDWSFTLTDAF